MAIALDASGPLPVTSSGATTTTAAFTPPSSSVIVATVSADANNGSNDETVAVSDSAAGTWNTAVLGNGNGGAVSAIFWRLCATSPGSITVSCTDNKGSVAKRLCVQVWTGTDQTTPIGATTAATTAGVSYTSTVDQSQGVSCGLTANAVLTAGGTGNTLVDEAGGFDSGDAVFTLNRAALTTPAGSTVTLTITGTSTIGHHVAAELVPPGGAVAAPRVAPIISSTPAPPAAGRVALLRSTLVDPPVLTTQQPIVTSVIRRPAAGFAQVLRGTVTDPPVLTTPASIVVTRPVRPATGVVALLRSSLVDIVVSTASTPNPLVVTPAARPATTPAAYVGRSTFADSPVLTSPQPLVVVPAVKPVQQPTVLLLRASLIDLATPGPLVVAAATVTRRGVALLLRSTLADAVVATAATPRPLVLALQQPRATGRVLLLAAPAPGADCDCLVHRPNTGTTTRGSTGTTARPSTGTTARPCSC